MKDDYLATALRVFANVSIWIAAPVVIGVILGKYLDKRFNTEPWLFLATVGVCFLISIYGLVVNAKKEFKKIEEDAKKNKQK